MKVNIITIHDPDVNYGSTLQSCGTYNYIKQLGYDVAIIDYRPNYKTFIQRIRHTIPRIMYPKAVSERRAKINSYFKNHALLTKRYTSKSELEFDPPKADIYITGSDVIWNRDVNPEGADPSFYLGFVKDGVKISYAPSMGELQPAKNIEFIANLIKDFRFISVREEKSRKQLLDFGLSNVKCVVDPVFLLSSDYYKRQIHKNNYGDYTLVYLMSDTQKKRDIVTKLSNEYGDKIVAFGGLKKKSSCDIFIRNAGVEDFLSLIFHAKHIITDSFHCICFSIIFNKQFYYLPSIDSSMRIENILSYGKLEKRIITSIEDVNIPKIALEKIDYSSVMPLIDKKITESKDYIITALSECSKM